MIAVRDCEILPLARVKRIRKQPMEIVTLLQGFIVNSYQRTLALSGFIRDETAKLGSLQFLLLVFVAVAVACLVGYHLLATRKKLKIRCIALETDLLRTTHELNLERIWRRAGGDNRLEITEAELKQILDVVGCCGHLKAKAATTTTLAAVNG